MNESALRDALVMFGQSLYARGYAHGSSGNLSARLPDGLLVTRELLPRRLTRRASRVALADPRRR